MSVIQAIETHYNGYRFRSRLEARWAVFFDALGVRYEYEKEGFRLPAQRYRTYGREGSELFFPERWYLPDFWLPDLRYWVEIKGTRPTLEEGVRIGQMAHLTGYHGFVFYSTIGDVPIPDFGFEVQNIDWWWPAGGNGKPSSIDANENYTGMHWAEDLSNETIDICCGGSSIREFMEDKSTGAYVVTERIMAALVAARSARFEHGETPQILERVVYKIVKPSVSVLSMMDILVKWHHAPEELLSPTPYLLVHLNDNGRPLCAPLDPTKDGGFNIAHWRAMRVDVAVDNICRRCLRYSASRARRPFSSL